MLLVLNNRALLSDCRINIVFSFFVDLTTNTCFYGLIKNMINHNRNKLHVMCTVKILKFGTPQTIAIIVLKIEKFDVTLH